VNIHEDKNATRYTILFDKKLYTAIRSQATIENLKGYQYINKVLAEALGRDVPEYMMPKHNRNKKETKTKIHDKEPVQKTDEKTDDRKEAEIDQNERLQKNYLVLGEEQIL